MKMSHVYLEPVLPTAVALQELVPVDEVGTQAEVPHELPANQPRAKRHRLVAAFWSRDTLRRAHALRGLSTTHLNFPLAACFSTSSSLASSWPSPSGLLSTNVVRSPSQSILTPAEDREEKGLSKSHDFPPVLPPVLIHRFAEPPGYLSPLTGAGDCC